MKNNPYGRGACLSAHLILYLIGVLCVSIGRTQDINSPQYVGCFKTTYTNGVRDYMAVKMSLQPVTIDGCIAACGQLNYTYAGGDNFVECWCGNAVSNTKSNGCTNPAQPCNGNSSQICGAPGVISVYFVCPPGSFPWTPQGCLVQCGGNQHCITNTCLVTTAACQPQQCVTGWNGTRCDQDINECQEPSLNKCAQNCTNTPGSYYCTCNAGYSLQTNNQSCADIDECLNKTLSGCDGPCINTNGSFYCTCITGYQLRNDNKSCQGTSTTLQSKVTPGATPTIPLSAFIACVVVLLVCLIALSSAFAYLYFLYKNVNKALLVSATGSTIMSSSVVQSVGSNEESLTPGYEALTHDGADTSSVRVYEQIKKNGGSAVNTLYGEQFHNI